VSGVLIVDDNCELADNLGEILRDVGHRTCVCYSAYDALRVSAADAFQLALLDIRMPGMGGVELGAALLGEGRIYRCLFMTGACSEQDRAAACRLSHHDVLEKPLHLPRVIALAS
jgi:two-component system OmpR family response regulator